MPLVFRVIAQVNVSPSADGMPGADLIQRLLNWGQMIALWGSLGAILAGVAPAAVNMLFEAAK